MTTLPKDADARAEACAFIKPERRKEILAHLKALQGQAQSEAIKTILQGGGEPARFLTHVLGKDAPGPKDSPQTKKLGSPETT